MALLVEEPLQAQRFTIDGGAALERALSGLSLRVGQSVAGLIAPGSLEGVVLGGGYGRGQGGVLETTDGEAPYNDLEFYVFIRGNRLINEGRYGRRLRQIGEHLSQTAGLHVEFKIDCLADLRRREVSIFSYDLVTAHRVVLGNHRWFRGCEHHLDARRIVPAEPTRLLLNRCTGLLLARELLLQPELSDEDCDFIGRNIAKAKLALGDALLAALGEYHWDCRERARRLAQSDLGLPEELRLRVRPHHKAGVAFKLHPEREVKPPEVFQAELAGVADLALREWLWIENRRLRTRFASVADYALNPIHKCSPVQPFRSFLLNLRTFGVGALFDSYSGRYPRERLFNSLPLLLTGEKWAEKPELKTHLQRQLRTAANNWLGLVQAYKRVWACYG